MLHAPSYRTHRHPRSTRTVVFINRLDSGLATRINTTTPGVLNLVAANSSVLATRSISAASVSVWTFPNTFQSAPIFPNSSLAATSVVALQGSTLNQNTFVRYISIAAAPGKCLSFRELYALDNTLTNVALYKPTTQAADGAALASFTDPNLGFTSFASYGTDGVIDMDNLGGGNMVNLPCDGTGTWMVDLGGVYNLTRVIFFNRA